jgi:hypothetical protein
MPSFERRFEGAEECGHAGQFRSHNVSGYTEVQSMPLYHKTNDRSQMFFRPNIHYSLLRTGSVQVTSNAILEKGFLDAVRF